MMAGITEIAERIRDLFHKWKTRKYYIDRKTGELVKKS
jgi:hypothetical protein